MIDPTNVTKYDRTEAELEEWLLFCIVAAGKTAKTQAKLLNNFLTSLRENYGSEETTPFQLIWNADNVGALRSEIEKSRLGQYNRLEKSFRKTHDFIGKMKSITIEELETIPGVGPKTSRFYLLHSRQNQNYAVLDTHILHYMRDNCLTTLKVTPSGNVYKQTEQTFLNHANSINKTLADLDLEIWVKYSGS